MAARPSCCSAAGSTGPDPAVTDNLVDLWTRFAKTGNPNGGMNVTWPRYTRAATGISISILLRRSKPGIN